MGCKNYVSSFYDKNNNVLNTCFHPSYYFDPAGFRGLPPKITIVRRMRLLFSSPPVVEPNWETLPCAYTVALALCIFEYQRH